MNLREAAQQALEALELAGMSHDVMLMSDPPQDAWKARGVSWKLAQAMTALRAALEPVTDCHEKEGDKLSPPFDQSENALGMVEPVGYGVFEDGNLHDSYRLEHEAKLFAALKGEHAEVKALYIVAPTVREDRTVEATVKQSLIVEPVAYVTGYYNGRPVVKPVDTTCVLPTGMALYRSPPKRKPLTNEQIQKCVGEEDDARLSGPITRLIRAVERAHGIGGEE